MRNLTRRTVIGSGAAAALVGSGPTAHALPALTAGITSPRIARLYALAAKIVEHEREDPTEERMEAHERELDDLLDQVNSIAEEVWATPVNGLVDVLERGVVALSYWAEFSGPDGHVMDLESACMGDRSAAHLIAGVLGLAGLPWGGANA